MTPVAYVGCVFECELVVASVSLAGSGGGGGVPVVTDVVVVAEQVQEMYCVDWSGSVELSAASALPCVLFATRATHGSAHMVTLSFSTDGGATWRDAIFPRIVKRFAVISAEDEELFVAARYGDPLNDTHSYYASLFVADIRGDEAAEMREVLPYIKTFGLWPLGGTQLSACVRHRQLRVCAFRVCAFRN